MATNDKLIEEAASECENLFGEGYIDRIGEFESIRGYLPIVKRKVSALLYDLIEKLQDRGFSLKAARSEAASILSQVESEITGNV